jgi:hypothetical protein
MTPSRQLGDLAGEATKPAPEAEPHGSCLWCERPFQARRDGGKRQVFCRTVCRRAFHAAVRTWVLGELAAGNIAISDVRNGPPATRALPTHAAPPSQPASADGQECLSDDFGRLLDEMDEILGEWTIALLIRLGWLARDRQKDHAAVLHALCLFVGHLLDMARNGRP